MNEERKQEYFAELAPRYNVLTGNTTRDIFAKFIEDGSLAIDSSSIVHDNGAGPGTATQALITYVTARDVFPTVYVTDYAAGMVEVLESIRKERVAAEPGWKNVHTKICNSADLTSFPDDFFTHSVNNFSLFTMSNPIQCLKETYRTLRPGGTASVLLWKKYAVQDLLADAQDIVKGPGYASTNAVAVNGPQYYQEGVVEEQMQQAGFLETRMNTVQAKHVLHEGDDWNGLLEYMTSSSIAEGSTKSWSTEEKGRWNSAIVEAMRNEKARSGGIEFVSWITVAQK